MFLVCTVTHNVYTYIYICIYTYVYKQHKHTHTYMHAILRPASVPACVCTHLPLGERNLQVHTHFAWYHRPGTYGAHSGAMLEICIRTALNPNPECVGGLHYACMLARALSALGAGHRIPGTSFIIRRLLWHARLLKPMSECRLAAAVRQLQILPAGSHDTQAPRRCKAKSSR